MNRRETRPTTCSTCVVSLWYIVWMVTGNWTSVFLMVSLSCLFYTAYPTIPVVYLIILHSIFLGVAKFTSFMFSLASSLLWDYFLFVQQSPGGICYFEVSHSSSCNNRTLNRKFSSQGGKNCEYAHNITNWTMHGIW